MQQFLRVVEFLSLITDESLLSEGSITPLLVAWTEGSELGTIMKMTEAQRLAGSRRRIIEEGVGFFWDSALWRQFLREARFSATLRLVLVPTTDLGCGL